MEQSQPVCDQARTKLIQIFRYVQAFNRLQNPVPQDIQGQPWTLWFHDLPDHPCIRLNASASAPMESSQPSPITHNGSEPKQNFILKVSRPKLTEPPDPPQEIETWLLHGWQEVDGTVAIDPKKAAELAADSRLHSRFEEWKGRR
ncbi:MAG TPA: hypothetical protein VGT82_06680, partial [Ktedonobacteraceae bacterium]|nr:hypothetical protein [Ktedonobacteraceae bacterium]